MTQVTTKQFGDDRRGIGSRFNWVEGKELYLYKENRQEKKIMRRQESIVYNDFNTLANNGLFYPQNNRFCAKIAQRAQLPATPLHRLVFPGRINNYQVKISPI